MSRKETPKEAQHRRWKKWYESKGRQYWKLRRAGITPKQEKPLVSGEIETRWEDEPRS